MSAESFLVARADPFSIRQRYNEKGYTLSLYL